MSVVTENYNQLAVKTGPIRNSRESWAIVMPDINTIWNFKTRSPLCLSTDFYWKCSLNWTMIVEKKICFRIPWHNYLVNFVPFGVHFLRRPLSSWHITLAIKNRRVLSPFFLSYSFPWSSSIVPDNHVLVRTFFFSGSHYSLYCAEGITCS